MAITKFLARDLTIEVRDDDGLTFLPIGGLQSITHSPAKTDADTTDFDSNGRARHIPAQRGDSFSLAGQALLDSANGDKDPGQERVEDLSRLTGLTAMGTFRLTDPGGNKATFDASVDLTLPGGGTNDAASWGATILVDGEIVHEAAS